MGDILTVRPPAYLWIPDRLGSYGDEAVDLAKLYGRPLDPEQEIATDAMLSYGPGGKSAALEVADIKVRQNGKTGGEMTAVALYRAFICPPDRTIWTAHLFKTCREAFNDHVQIIDGCDWLRRQVKKVRQANGEEGIELTSGAVIDYMARSKGGGRGLGGGTLILDEALYLLAQIMAAIFPTLSARPDPLVVYGSSPGVQESEHLRSIRDRGRKGGDPSLAYIEHCAPGSFAEPSCELGKECTHLVGDDKSLGCAFDNEAYREMANPAMPRRISRRYVDGERRALPPREFGRERMGWWDDPIDADVEAMLDVKAWGKRTDVRSLPGDGQPLAVAFDVAPGLDSASVTLATYREDGDVHLELIKTGRGTAWLARYLNGTEDEDGLVDRLGIDDVTILPTEYNQATLETMPEELQELVTILTRAEVPAACVRFEALIDPTVTPPADGGPALVATQRQASVLAQMANPGPAVAVADLGLWHLGDELLQAGIVGLRKRPIGDGAWVPSRANSLTDISGVCAGIASVHALLSADQPMDPGAERL